ncbi:MAG TPA: hypothetical protein VNE86_01935 [Nitrososphaerales archaeon]|nr:hypothetical protein [Nitrososphaerales archaeon]
MPFIECNWWPNIRPHSEQCDSELHESLSSLYTAAINYERIGVREPHNALWVIRDKLVECGAKLRE